MIGTLVNNAIIGKKIKNHDYVCKVLVTKVKEIWSKMEEVDVTNVLDQEKHYKAQGSMKELTEHFNDDVDLTVGPEIIQESNEEEQKVEELIAADQEEGKANLFFVFIFLLEST